MQRLLDRITATTLENPGRVAFITGDDELTYGKLHFLIDQLARKLEHAQVDHLGILLDNGVEWIVAQLAAFSAGVTVTPIPAFFSNAQQTHVINASGIDLLLAPHEGIAQSLDANFVARDDIHPLAFRRAVTAVARPAGTCLITYTSGTTGEPKAVCLGSDLLLSVCQSLYASTVSAEVKRHLCILPLPILLENMAGVFVPLYAGATSIVLPAERTGLLGSTQLDLARFCTCLERYQPESLNLTPELLSALLSLIGSGLQLPSLKFVAVGGARVAKGLLQTAQSLGVPVYQGYGLSECGSVVSLNRPGKELLGSVGPVLPHCLVKISPKGEVLVAGASHLGYLGEPTPARVWLKTGDLGRLDEEGFLHIEGRAKNLHISSFGRNLAPEWVESEMLATAQLAQACLYGDSKPFNVALITPRKNISRSEIDQCIEQLNDSLPDYARIRHWLPTEEPFSSHNGQLTPNGRLRREKIYQHYHDQLERLYA